MRRMMQTLAVIFFCGVLAISAWHIRDKASANADEEIQDTGVSKDADRTEPDMEQTALEEEPVSVHILGLEHSYRFIFVSDLHVIVENEEISPEHLENVQARRESFRTADGTYSAQLWEEMPEIFNAMDADAILLGGDMIDYASTANIGAMKEGIEKLGAPVLYVRAVHVYNPYNCDGLDKKDMKKLHQSIDGYEGISLIEYDDLCIVGINDSTKQITKKQLKRFKEIVALGKPIILLTHVPLESKVDTSLSEESKKVWQDRALLWGEGAYYEPNKNTQAFLDMVYADDSPVKAVVCGHLHFSWEGKLTENCFQHVFQEMYSGRYGMITVDGQASGT